MGFVPPPGPGKNYWPTDYFDALSRVVNRIVILSKATGETTKVFNFCLEIKEVRDIIKKHHPEYTDKVKLWEVLHGE